MNRTISYLAALVLLAGLGSTSAAAQGKKKTESQDAPVTTARNDAVPSEVSMPGSSGAKADPSYIIGPEDVLDVSIWKEPEVSRIVPVRPDGKISLPLISDVQAAGLTPPQLAVNVTDKLRKFLNEPQVTVIVTAINSQRIYVVGEVLRAGAFPLIPGMTVLQALSSAGGFTTFADVKKVHILRMVNGKQAELPFNYREVLKGDNPEQNIKLEPGDTVVVP